MFNTYDSTQQAFVERTGKCYDSAQNAWVDVPSAKIYDTTEQAWIERLGDFLELVDYQNDNIENYSVDSNNVSVFFSDYTSDYITLAVDGLNIEGAALVTFDYNYIGSVKGWFKYYCANKGNDTPVSSMSFAESTSYGGTTDSYSGYTTSIYGTLTKIEFVLQIRDGGWTNGSDSLSLSNVFVNGKQLKFKKFSL